jgi:hypothetical protein
MPRYYVARTGSLNRSKVSAKHNIQFKNEAHSKEYSGFVYGSVRNKVLKKLLVVDSMIKNSWIRRELVERYKDDNRDNPELLVTKFGYSGNEDSLQPCELMHYLGPADIMKVLGCNRRTAAEYKDALDCIHSKYESICLCGS